MLPFVKTEDVVVTYKQENLRKYNEMKRTAGVSDQEKGSGEKVNKFFLYRVHTVNQPQCQSFQIKRNQTFNF